MDALLEDFRKGSEFAFGMLYEENFGMISNFVLNNSGSVQDAEDLFQDAMLVLVEKLRMDDFQLTASLNTYVYAICKNLWLKKLRNSSFLVDFEDIQEEHFQKSIHQSIEDEMSYLEKLKSYMLKISSHCNRLIHDIFFRDKSIDQIQSEYGYSTRHNAQNQKHKCIQQIKKVKEKEGGK